MRSDLVLLLLLVIALHQGAVADGDQIANDTADNLLSKFLKDHPPKIEGVDALIKKASYNFVWYDPLQVTGEPKPIKTLPVTTTM